MLRYSDGLCQSSAYFLCERNRNSESQFYFILQVENTLSYSYTVGSLRRAGLSTQCHVAVPGARE